MNSIQGFGLPPTDDMRIAAGEGRSLLDVAATIVRWRWRFVVGVLLGALAGLAWASCVSPVYTSRAAIFAQGSGTGSRLAGLASQFGINVGNTQSTPGPQLYLSMLQSENVLRRVAAATYRFTDDGREQSTTLVELFGGPHPDSSVRRANATAALRQVATTSVDEQSGLLRLSVSTGSRELSFQIAQRMLSDLEAHHTELRKRQVEGESRFVEARLAEQANELRNSEDRMQQFLTRNRLYENDPRLVLEYNRLSRTLQMQQAVYTSLAQGFHQVRIDASRNTPTLSVVQDPLLADSPTLRPYTRSGILGAVLGSGVVLLALLFREYMAVLRLARPDPYDRLVSALTEASANSSKLIFWRKRTGA